MSDYYTATERRIAGLENALAELLGYLAKHDGRLVAALLAPDTDLIDLPKYFTGILPGPEVRELRAGGGTEPHDGDVSRLLRLWAKPLRGLLNRPEDALALERAADVIESGGMDSVFTREKPKT